MATGNKITPSSPRLASLLSDVERGNIKIPVFQRDYIWTDEQIISLLDSVYRGYPVGSLLLWSTKEELKYERNVGGFVLPQTPEDYPVNYILDGQQRLTTLYGVFHSDAETKDAELADRFNICYVPEDDEFVHHLAASGKRRIFLRDILNTTRLLSHLKHFNEIEQAKIALVTERFKDYEFPVVTIKERANAEVCAIFQRINSSGTPLSNLELLTAWTWSDKFDLRREIEILLDALKDKGYEQIDQSLLMRCLAAISIESIDSDTLVDVPSDQLVSGMKSLKKALYSTVDFLEGQLKIRNIIFLPFPLMVVPIAFFFSKNAKPSASQITQLRKWFWHCSFTLRYRAGTNRMVLADLSLMKDLAAGREPFDYSSFEPDASIFRKTWRINSTAAKVAVCMLAQKQPKSFLSGNNVDLGSVLAAYNAREFHHIYPKGYLSDQGVPFHEANLIANICFLSAADNKNISDGAPKDYFKLIPDAQRDAIFDAALIPEEARLGLLSYDEFINQRSVTLSEVARKLVRDGSI